MFYFVSLLLNLVYYLMHPSSPEMWTWGAAMELEEWGHRQKRKTKRQSDIADFPYSLPLGPF